MNQEASFEDFLKIDIRVGTVIEVKAFEKAKKPAYQVWVDFGEAIGIKKTSAQITQRYELETIIGKQVMGVVNFPKKQIANFQSEFLLLGMPDENGYVVLVTVDVPVPNGGRLF